MVALCAAWYNLLKMHDTLRMKSAMAAGLIPSLDGNEAISPEHGPPLGSVSQTRTEKKMA